VADIYAWEDDPGQPPSARQPVARPRPDLSDSSLPIDIEEEQPAEAPSVPGGPDFLWWTAADALDRGQALWSELAPAALRWHPDVGEALSVRLNGDVEQLNAYYDRERLEFFQDTVRGVTCSSAESADIVIHELGHAVLDALRPQLWDATGTEPAAFHEAFGDISSLLVGLQLEPLRERVLLETSGKLWRSSRVSRIAEQLGWAIRQVSPDRAEPHCLRDTANSWFYRDPALLSPDSPASELSTEPHSFARVFTGAFLKLLAAMFDAESERDGDTLGRVGLDAGALLVEAVRSAPIVPAYFSQLAAHMLAADERRFDGKYAAALRFGFVRHGILALSSAQGLADQQGIADTGDADDDEPELPSISLAGQQYGLPPQLLVHGCVQTEARRFGVAGSAPDAGAVVPPSSDRAAELFLEDLVRLGRVESDLASPMSYKTHELREADNGYELRRRVFDCGLHPPGCRG